MARFPRILLLVALGLMIAASTFGPALASLYPGSGVRPAKAVTIPLYGDGQAPANGWGFGPSNITFPGPDLHVQQGDVITFNLFSNDTMPHILVIDLNSDGTRQPTEPESGQFTSSTSPTTFQYTADTAGTIQYFCGIHGAALQRGRLIVAATTTTPPAGDNTILIVGGVIVIVAVLGVAGAMMMRRKPKA